MRKSKRAIKLQEQYLNNKKVVIEKKYSHLDRMKHMSWCLKNGIKIYIEPMNYRHGRIIIEEKGKRKQIDGLFILNEKYIKKDSPKYWEFIMKLYTDIYENKNV